METWVDVPAGCHFPLANLPFGVMSSRPHPRPHVGVAIGGHVLCLVSASARGLLDGVLPGVGDPHDVFDRTALNPLMALGRPAWDALRTRLMALLTDESVRGDVQACLVPQADVRMHLPVRGGRLRRLLLQRAPRDERRAHLPARRRPHSPRTGSTCRSATTARPGTVVVSGTDVVRPHGQRRPPEAAAPVVRPHSPARHRGRGGLRRRASARRSAAPCPRARSTTTSSASCSSTTGRRATSRHGSTSPLGPFLGKSFATSVSPWVVPLAALEAARVDAARRRTRRAAATCAGPRTWGLDLVARGRAQRRGGLAPAVRDDVLDARPSSSPT